MHIYVKSAFVLVHSEVRTAEISTALQTFEPVSDVKRLINSRSSGISDAIGMHIRMRSPSVQDLGDFAPAYDAEIRLMMAIQRSIAWQTSALLGKNRDASIQRMYNFTVRCRRKLIVNKSKVLKRLATGSAYWQRIYKKQPKDDKCELCGKAEEQFHFLDCRAHDARRLEATDNIKKLINQNLPPDQQLADVPIFWATEQQHTDAPPPEWTEIELFATERSATGFIPTKFVSFLEHLPWNDPDKLPNIIADIQIEAVAGHYDSWREACRAFNDPHRNPQDQQHEQRAVDRINARLKRRDKEKNTRKISRKAAGLARETPIITKNNATSRDKDKHLKVDHRHAEPE